MAYTPTLGDIVVRTESIVVFSQITPLSGAAGGSPLLGTVDDAAGPYKVAWANGEYTTYADATGLAKVASPTDVSLFHEYVNVPFIAGQAYGASTGIVVSLFKVTTNGTTYDDFAVIEFSGGSTAVVPTALVQVLESNQNVN